MAKKLAHKQQQREVKRRKERAERQRQLRHQTQRNTALERWNPADLENWEIERPPIPNRPKPDPDEQALRPTIQKFAYQKRFAADFEQAMELYFGKGAGKKRVLSLEEADTANFQEWFFHDYVTATGERIIDLLEAEVGPTLPPTQQQILHDWISSNRQRLLEVQEVTPGVGEIVKDLLNGEVFRVNDISFSYGAKQWNIALARTLLTQGRWHFTGAGNLIPPLYKQQVVEPVQALWQVYQQQNPQATVDDFYRDRSLDVRNVVAESQRQPLYDVYVTNEGHPLIDAVAEYRIHDRYAVLDLLDEAEEFNDAGPEEDDPEAEHYNWLARGRSSVPSVSPMPDRALILKSEWTLGPGQPTFLSLGDVTVEAKRLKLSCLSRQRLSAGRALLEQLLGDLITHQRDHFSEMKLNQGEGRASQRTSLPAKPLSLVEKRMQKELFVQQAEAWLDNPIPKLGNLSPRQAVKTPAGRAEVAEMLKTMEYLEAERREEGQPYINTRAIRRELGLL